jgi:hypothetical protein
MTGRDHGQEQPEQVSYIWFVQIRGIAIKIEHTEVCFCARITGGLLEPLTAEQQRCQDASC